MTDNGKWILNGNESRFACLFFSFSFQKCLGLDDKVYGHLINELH